MLLIILASVVGLGFMAQGLGCMTFRVFGI